MARSVSVLAVFVAVLTGCGGKDHPVAHRVMGQGLPVVPEVTTTEPSTTTTEMTTTSTVAPVASTVAGTATPRTTVVVVAPTVKSTPATTGSGACGGDLPPCRVMQRESGGDPTAIGYGQCGEDDCYGKWQIDPDTAESVGYPRRLDLQPEEVQDDAARAIKARDGCGAWSTC